LEIAQPAAALQLPRGIASPPASVDETIRVRRSTRSFESGPLSLEDLGFVLEMAQGHAALTRAPGVELLVVAHRVEGLAVGLYRYDSRAHALASLRMGDLREALTRTCLGQEKAGEAGIAIAMVAEVARSAAARGERAYRDLLVEAGAIGERVYLAAEARRLSARNLAAFRDGELNALLGTDGRERAVIHLTLVGRGD
jgi:SagB-type dehydrogenase family enzyme